MSATVASKNWPGTQWRFAGWVPAISCHLSFSLIGKLGELRACDTLNEEDERRQRTITVIQRRTMGDLPSKSKQQLLEMGATSDYILIADTGPASHPVVHIADGLAQWVKPVCDELGVVRGRIYILPRHQDPTLRLMTEQLVYKLRLLVRRAHKSARTAPATTIQQMVKNEIAEAAAKGAWLPSAEFALYRTGEARFWCDKSDINPGNRPLVDDTPPINAALPADPHETFAPRLCAQLYYFLKDITHRHYHHDSSADNILPLCPASAEDDTSWRRETLYSLARAVLEKRRQNLLRAYRQAEGMLAYCDAFQGTLAPIKRSTSDYEKFEPFQDRAGYDFQTLRASIGAGYNEHAWNRSSNLQVAAVALSILVALPPLWLGALQSKSALCEPSSLCPNIAGWAQNLARQLLEHPGSSAILIAVILFVLFTWASEGFRDNPAYRALVRPFNRLRQSATVSLGNRWRLKGKPDPYGDALLAVQLALFLAMLLVSGLATEVLGVTTFTPISSWITAATKAAMGH